MARRDKYTKLQDKELAAVLREIDSIYADLAATIGFVGETAASSVDRDKPFSLSDYPFIKARVDKALQRLAKKLDISIVNGVRSQWTLANDANNELCRMVFGDALGKIAEAQRRRYFNNNDTALAAFLTRKEKGLSLSQRVWNYAEQTRGEIESTLELGIKTGEDAASMARDLKEYLKFPDKLFRRVRDEEGRLHLSKNAAAFHPGQGVYRSSYKNARRLAATENNMSYATADYLRQTQLDFVVGFRVNLSNNHTCLNDKGVAVPFHDICDELKGDYPKWFKFVGWHPQCRCYTTTILKTPEEVMRDSDGIDRGSVNEVKDLPPQFKDWVERNEARIERAEDRGTLPYFLRDNEWAWKEGVPIPNVPRPKTALLTAEERHAARTPEDIADIKARWLERQTAYNDAEIVLHLADSIPDLEKYWKNAKDASGDSLDWMAERLKALRYEYNTGKIKSYERLRSDAEEILSYIKDLRDDLKLLDNPLKVMQQWGAETAFEVQRNVARTMARYEHESDKVKAQKYRYEADWIEGHRKHSIPTWKVAQDAYLKAAKELEWKIEWEALTEKLDRLARDAYANDELVARARQYIGKDKKRAEEAIEDVEDTIRLETAKVKFRYYYHDHPKLLASFADAIDMALDPADAERALAQAKVFVDAWDDMEMRAKRADKKVPEAMRAAMEDAIRKDDYPALTKAVENAENYIALESMRNDIRDILKGYSDLIENYDYHLYGALQDDLLGATLDQIADVQLDVRKARNIIKDYNDTYDDFSDHYEDYDTKSKSYLGLVEEAKQAVYDYDLRRLKSVVEKLRAEKDRLEKAKKYAEEKAAEWKSLVVYAERVKALNAGDEDLDELIADLLAESKSNMSIKRGRVIMEAIKARMATLGLSISSRKTIDDLRRELGDKLPKTIEEIDTAISKFKHTNAHLKSVENQVNDLMFKFFEDNDLGMDVHESDFESICKKGFLNTFQVGKSSGYNGSHRTSGEIEHSHGRLRFSHRAFRPSDWKHFDNPNEATGDYDGPQLKRSEYEKYGHLLDRDKYQSIKHNLSGYGEIQVRFKRDRVIATWTFDDSLHTSGRYYQPSLVTDPRVESFDDMDGTMEVEKVTDWSSVWKWQRDGIHKRTTSYIELQYHGDVTLDAVESFTFRKNPEYITNKTLLKQLLDKGIEIWYVDGDKVVRYMG